MKSTANRPNEILGSVGASSKRQRLHLGWLLLTVLLLAAAVRLANLADRPIHTDEAVNAFQVGQILQGAPWRYQCSDFHGPLFFAISAFTARVQGCKSLASLDERILRLPAVLCSLLLIPLCYWFLKPVGAPAALFAGWLCALEPVGVYFGRYAIHESLLVSLTLGFLLAVIRALESGTAGSQLAAGALAGLMVATKETAVIALLAALVSAPLLPGGLRRLNWRVFLYAGGAACAVAVFCFTWGFKNPKALLELLSAGQSYLSRAGGQGHEKPWFYYFVLMSGFYSGQLLVVLAAAGAWLSWRGRLGPGRFLSVYAALVFLLYLAIPYKTPWLLLNVILPLLLLAALLLSALWRRSRGVALLATFVFTLVASMDLKKFVFRMPADERNPLAYSHTLEDLTTLPLAIERWKERNGREPRITVVASDPWPLPWYLRQHPKVGYWNLAEGLPESDLLIYDQHFAETLLPERQGWRASIFGQRPGALLFLYRPPESAP